MKKAFFLYDDLSAGHHKLYFRMVLKKLLDRGKKVIAVYSDPENLSQNICGGDVLFERPILAKRSRFEELIPGLRAFQKWRNLSRVIRRIRREHDVVPEFVFILWLDDFLQGFIHHRLVRFVFRHRWGGFYFHPTFMRKESRYLSGYQRRHSPIRDKQCIRVGIFDEGILDDLRRLFGSKVSLCPDFTYTGIKKKFPLLEIIQKKAAGRKVVGLLGEISRRKGLYLLLELAKKLTGCLFVFAGEFDQTLSIRERAELEKVRNKENTLFLTSEPIDDDEFNAVLASCDVVPCAYLNFFHSSNILTKAAYFQKPVIVSRGYCLAERVERFALGLVVKENDIGAMAEAIEYLSDVGHYSRCLTTAQFQSYYSLHNETRFNEFIDLLSDLVTGIRKKTQRVECDGG